jgi:hypothetical protein
MWIQDVVILPLLAGFLMDRRRHSSILNVRSFRAADCHTDHYLAVAKIRERLAVSKQTMQRVHIERFNLKKLNEVEGKEKYRVEISNRFTALENLRHWVGINRSYETIRENIKDSAKERLGYYEMNHGHAVAQAISRWLPTTVAWVRVQAACGVCGGQSSTGAGFYRVLQFPLPIVSPISPSS